MRHGIKPSTLLSKGVALSCSHCQVIFEAVVHESADHQQEMPAWKRWKIWLLMTSRHRFSVTLSSLFYILIWLVWSMHCEVQNLPFQLLYSQGNPTTLRKSPLKILTEGTHQKKSHIPLCNSCAAHFSSLCLNCVFWFEVRVRIV